MFYELTAIVALLFVIGFALSLPKRSGLLQVLARKKSGDRSIYALLFVRLPIWAAFLAAGLWAVIAAVLVHGMVHGTF
jgi:hypothetical protein